MPACLHSIRPALAFAFVLAAAPVHAQSAGTYRMDGGSYTLTVEVGADELVVIEPNKRSVYRRVGSTSEYRFFNPTTGSTFSLTVVDDRTLRASRVPQTAAPDILRLVGAAAASAAAAEQDRFKAIADRYRLLAEGDTDNTQMWTFCAAAAQGWALKAGDDAAVYAWKAAQQLKPIMVDPARTPCRDAIPQALWDRATVPEPGSALASAPLAPAASRAVPGATGAATAAAPAPATGTATAALRERAAASTGAAAASQSEVAALGAQREQEVRDRARAELQGEATKLATRALSGAGVEQLSRVAPMLPSLEQWLTVFKDYAARRKAIRDQDEYVAALRADRLAAGTADVQGFAKPVRPTPDTVVHAPWGARVTGYGVTPDYNPATSAHWIQQLDAFAKNRLSDGSYVAWQEPRGGADRDDWRPGFSATLARHRARLQFVVESTEGKLPKYQNYACSVYGPDGRELSRTQLTAPGDTKRHTLELNMVSRAWTPGVYGAECWITWGKPIFNLTFEVVE